MNVDKITCAFKKFLGLFGFCTDWFLRAFCYAIVCTFAAYMAAIIDTLWEKSSNNHLPLILMFAICAAVGFYDAWSGRKKKEEGK